MWLADELYARATMEMREEEARRARLVSEARSLTEPQGDGRAWRWRIEPGMEDVFRDLQGWLLSGRRDARVDTQAGEHQQDHALPACCRRAA